MDTQKDILHRSATRQFLDRPVKDTVLKNIIKTSQQAPTWIDAQEMRVIIATGDTLEKIRQNHKKINDDPNQHTHSDVQYTPIRDWDAASQKNMNQKIALTAKFFGQQKSQVVNSHKDNLFNAPAIAYITLPAHYAPYSLFDAGILAQTIMLAAQDQGVGSLPAFEFVKYPDHLRKFLRTSADQKFILGVGLGYRDEKAPINKIHPARMPLDRFLTIRK